MSSIERARKIFVFAAMAMSTLLLIGCVQPTAGDDSAPSPAKVGPTAVEVPASKHGMSGTRANTGDSAVQADQSSTGFFLGSPRQYVRLQDGVPVEYDALVVGDVTGDGRADLIASPGIYNQVELFVQKADGTLAAPVIYPYSSNNYIHARQLVLADFNRDNVLDVAASANTNSGISGGVYVLLSDGNGGLTGRIATPPDVSTFRTPTDWNVIDVNQDSYLDIVGAEQIDDYSGGAECGPYQWTCPRLTIYYGDGRGSFPTTEQLRLRQPYNLVDMEANDVNDDGRPDLIFTFKVLGQNGGPSRADDPGRVMVALQQPNGLGPLADLHPRLAYEGDHLVFADVTGDGIDDSITFSTVRRRLLDNEYAAPFQLPSYRTDSTQIIAVDIDGDRRADLIEKQIRPTGGLWEGEVMAIYLQRDGQLQAPLFYQLGSFAVSYRDRTFAVGDINGDGCNDLIVALRNQQGILIWQGAQCSRPQWYLPDESGVNIRRN